MKNKTKKGDEKRINKLYSNKKNKKKKARYKIRNWREYNESLVRRYDINVWIEKGIAEVWQEGNTIIIRKKKQGAPRIYSNMAIECLVTVQDLFNLPYRGIEGFARSLIPVLLQKKVNIPDYSTINRRRKYLSITLPHKTKNKEGKTPIDIVIDSSGLKVYGEGEWKVRQHGISKRRTWRKIHLGVNPKTGFIEASELTENRVDDAAMVESLLNNIDNPIDKCAGDGAYDKRKVYEIIRTKVQHILIPPCKGARIWFHGNKRSDPHPRDENIRMIRKLGRTKWKKESGYHMRSLSEVAIYRFKTILGNTLSARIYENQRTEVAIKCKILNKMTSLGMPDSYKVDLKVM